MFRPHYGLAPEVGRESRCRPAPHSNEVVPSRLNLFLCQVVPETIWREKLVGHDRLFYLQSVRRGYLIVNYLVSKYYALRFHPF